MPIVGSLTSTKKGNYFDGVPLTEEQTKLFENVVYRARRADRLRNKENKVMEELDKKAEAGDKEAREKWWSHACDRDEARGQYEAFEDCLEYLKKYVFACLPQDKKQAIYDRGMEIAKENEWDSESFEAWWKEYSNANKTFSQLNGY